MEISIIPEDYFFRRKKLNDKHSISLIAFGAPTRRAGQSAVTKETHDLAGGSVYYNPYWGYQNGKIRNFENRRIFRSYRHTFARMEN